MRNLTFGMTAACAALLVSLQFAGHLSARSASVDSSSLAQSQATAPSSVFVDVHAADEAGRPLTALRAEDLRVTIDKEPRRILSLRYVFRGPGAEASAGLADPARDAPAAAERSRLVLVLIDESSFPLGGEKAAVAAAGRILVELGTADQSAVVTLPLRRNTRIALNADASARQAELGRVQGRARLDLAPAVTLMAPAAPTPLAGGGTAEDQMERRAEQEREMSQPERGDSGKPADQEVATSESPLRSILQIVDGLRGANGPKHVIVIRQADASNEPGDTSAAMTREAGAAAVVQAAARARSAIHFVLVGKAGRRPNQVEEALRAVAQGTGGTVTTAAKAGDAKPFDALRAALWGSYLVEVEGREADASGSPRTLAVETPRARTTLRAAQQWVLRNDPVPRIVEPARVRSAASPAATGGAAAGRPDTAVPPGARFAQPRPADPELAILLARVSEYLEAYLRDFSSVVAEEDYWQEVVRGWRTGAKTRRLKSDILLVKTDWEIGWLQYRDVFEVDGKPVRDRDQRVQKLFIENRADAVQKLFDISSESSRYNLGSLERTINVPTLPLALLAPAVIPGIAFERKGETTIEGIRAVRLGFREQRHPTLIRQMVTEDDVPSSGSFWVDPTTGRILKTEMRVSPGGAEVTITVTYRPGGNTGLWVPARMDETYKRPGEEVAAQATYARFRSFNVTTDVKVTDPVK